MERPQPQPITTRNASLTQAIAALVTETQRTAAAVAELEAYAYFYSAPDYWREIPTDSKW